MNKIEQLHLDEISKIKTSYQSLTSIAHYKKFAAEKCAKITTGLLGEFADFLYEEPNFTKWASGKTDSQELLDKFIKEYENN